MADLPLDDVAIWKQSSVVLARIASRPQLMMINSGVVRYLQPGALHFGLLVHGTLPLKRRAINQTSVISRPNSGGLPGGILPQLAAGPHDQMVANNYRGLNE